MGSEPQDSLLPEFDANAQGEQGGLFEEASMDDSFVEAPLKSRYSPDDRPFESFYVPLLSRAIAYDRAVGYWSATELQFAAQGTAHFLANGGRMRLIVGAQLYESDVAAVLHGVPLTDVLATRMLSDPGLAGAKIVADEHLSVLAWMVANGRLEIRVGVPRDGETLLSHSQSGRYFHTKFGIFTDRHGNKVAFEGSNNASVRAWVANFETFTTAPSWLPVWEWNGRDTVLEFEKLWNGSPDHGWAVIPLPVAVRERLIEHAPPLPPLPEAEREALEGGDRDDESALPVTGPSLRRLDVDAAWQELVRLAALPAAEPYTAVGTAQVELLPHQAKLIDRVVGTVPRGYLFADEVGLGKTIEAGMVLRELMLSGQARRALLLVPASVMKQWQEELHEKMNLDVPRFDRGMFLDRHDNEIPAAAGVNPWSAFPIVLASSHLARRRNRRQQIFDAGPWDLVLVDEAHHARRRGSKPSDTPNSLLALLLEMRDRQMWKSLYLASATPMQMNPHEAWDLISLFGLPGRWGDSAANFLGYFERLRASPQTRNWNMLRDMLSDYFSDPDAERDEHLAAQVAAELGFVGSYAVTSLTDNVPSAEARSQMPNATSEWMDRWLRRHNPMRDRVFRNTRNTLREYQKAGIIDEDVIIPRRHVQDEFIALTASERQLYDRIEDYIRRHYNAYRSDQSSQALGFIMTVYRRRLTSSFEAIRKSLTRRLSVLEEGKDLAELLADDDNLDVEEALFDPETFDVSSQRLQDEIHELRMFLNDLNKITGEDSKASQLTKDVRESLLTYDSIVVFTQYTDTMDYVRDRLITAGITRIGCYSGRDGEVYDHTGRSWSQVSKSEIKALFRSGQLEVLIGTDSMSEGLNLQTSGRLINYDMPWNLMRVEQRIGRVDRIGARYRDIHVTNYFYADTVEQRVYEGIAEDYGDFTDIVGEAAPVLGNLERAIEELALGDANPDAIDEQVGLLKDEVHKLGERAVQASDLGAAPEVIGHIDPPPPLQGAVTLDDLQHTLTTNPLTGPLLTPVDGRPGVYELIPPVPVAANTLAADSGTTAPEDYSPARGDLPGVLVTFDRDISDTSTDEVVLLTYGSAQLEALLPRQKV